MLIAELILIADSVCRDAIELLRVLERPTGRVNRTIGGGFISYLKVSACDYSCKFASVNSGG